MSEPSGRSRRTTEAALVHLCHEFANANSLAEMFAVVVQSLVSTTGFARAAALAFDASGVMRFRAAHGLSDRYRTAVDGHSPWSIDTVDAQPKFVDDVRLAAELGALQAVLAEEGIRALAFLPLQCGGRLLGKFMLYSERPVAWRDVDLGFATAAADLLAGFLLREATQERLLQARKMESLGLLAGGIAHDFNNLLTSILGSVDLLRGETMRGTPARDYVEELLQAVEQAAELTKQLLGFARPHTAGRELVDLSAFVAEAAPVLRRLCEPSHRLVAAPSMDAAPVLANRAQLHQLLANLVANARDAMPDGGAIEIRVVRHAREGRVELAVVDHGVGMDEATRRRLFEPLFTTKPEGRGTGLGLATCYAIVSGFGGDIAVRSTPGHGSTFLVALPLAHAATVAPPTGASAATLLVVEDQELVMRTVVRQLTEHGYAVLTATDGKAALDVLGSQRVDAVVTDLVMPRMGGLELAAAVRARWPAMPILLMTGFVDAPADVPADLPVLKKPFLPRELQHQVRELLRRSSAAGQATA